MTESIVIKLIIRAYYLLNEYFENSFAYRLLCKLGEYFGASKIIQFFRDLLLVKPIVYQNKFIRIVCTLWDLFFSLCRGVITFVAKMLPKSIFLGSLSKKISTLSQQVFTRVKPLEFFLGAFFVVMSITPHGLWSNPLIFVAAAFFMVFALSHAVLTPFPGKRETIKSMPPTSLIIYCMVVILSFFSSYAFMDSIRIMLIFLSCIVLSLCIAYAVKNQRIFNVLMTAIFIGMFLTSMLGIAQRVLGIEIRAEFVDMNASEGLPGRIFSTMDNPNNYAEYLILLIPICIAYILSLKSDIARFIYTGMLAPCMLCLLLTYSRASYLSFLIAAFVFVLIVNPRLVPFFIILGLAAIPFIPSTILNRFLTIGKDTSSNYRLLIWKGASRMMKENWLMGIGMGPATFERIYKGVADPYATNAMHSHNLIFQIIIETGIFGLLSFVIFVFSIFKRNLITALKTPSQEYKYYAAAFCATIVSFIFFAMVEYVWYYPRVTLTFWIVMGLSMGFFNLQQPRIEVVNNKRKRL